MVSLENSPSASRLAALGFLRGAGHSPGPRLAILNPPKCAEPCLRERSGRPPPGAGVRLVKRSRQGRELGMPVPSGGGWGVAGAQGF